MRGHPATRESELVLAAVLFDMVQGRAPTPHSLGQATGLGDAAGSRLGELAAVGAVVIDGNGKIIAAYPLSAIPTSHRIQLDSLHPWANCAFDALAVPSMAGRRGVISSRCARCGAVIQVVVEGAKVVASSPAEVMVSYGGLANCCDRPSLEVSCPFIHFFCSPHHAQAWVRPEGWVGQLLTVEEATTLAVDRFRPVIELYKRYAALHPGGAADHQAPRP